MVTNWELAAAEAKIVDLQAEADAAAFKATHSGVLAKTVDNIAISDKVMWLLHLVHMNH